MGIGLSDLSSGEVTTLSFIFLSLLLKDLSLSILFSQSISSFNLILSCIEFSLEEPENGIRTGDFNSTFSTFVTVTISMGGGTDTGISGGTGGTNTGVELGGGTLVLGGAGLYNFFLSVDATLTTLTLFFPMPELFYSSSSKFCACGIGHLCWNSSCIAFTTALCCSIECGSLLFC